jgi:hypothetical protein
MAQSMGFPLVFRVCDKESMQRSNTNSNGLDGGCVGFSGKHHSFLVSEMHKVCRDQMQRKNGSDSGARMETNPHHCSILVLNCMCMGRHMSPMKMHALHQVCVPFSRNLG